MPGTYTFKPIEANLSRETGLIGRMNPYCAFVVGDDRINNQVCKKGGKHPRWDDSITIPMSKKPTEIRVEIMDKEMLTKDDIIGSFVLDLHEIQSRGQVSKWYPISYNDKDAGEILLEASFASSKSSKHTTLNKEEKLKQTESSEITGDQITSADVSNLEDKTLTNPLTSNKPSELTTLTDEEKLKQTNKNVFIEQKQVVEPRTFTKEVDVVETQSAKQQIEVMEPVKVLKDVQYTKAVPVKKQIEVVEPQVVTKEVEVMEPKLVTKTIQVVENVPVMKQVEVIESKTTMKEVETFEPQTFTKQIEVTEQVPVTKEVEVSEPVHVKKTVEYVEPVITTKTITKELVQPMIVDEQTTTEVGPASVAYSELTNKKTFKGEKIIDSSITGEKRSKDMSAFAEGQTMDSDIIGGGSAKGMGFAGGKAMDSNITGGGSSKDKNLTGDAGIKNKDFKL